MQRSKPSKKKVVFVLCLSLCVALVGAKTLQSQEQYLEYDKKEPAPPGTWKPVAYKAEAPTAGVTLGDGLFKRAMEANVQYLLDSFTVDQMLYWFRKRAGKPSPPEAEPKIRFWMFDLKGSCAGRFLIGAGNTLRWIEHKELRRRMNELIDCIEECQDPNGYILAYKPENITHNEQGNYARSMFTRGMIEASIAGNEKALRLMRPMQDWFNQCEWLPKMLLMSLGIQGHIANTRMYFTPVGKPEDIMVAEKYYVLNWWMEKLANRDPEAVWKFPLNRPHCYEITAFEAYLDHYRATGDVRYLNAMFGAWDLMHDNWEHIGGSSAICEGPQYPPKTYYITAKEHTGELCCSVFWIRFNQRFHLLFPGLEKYVAEIEKSIYNVGLANIVPGQGIRYHALLEGRKNNPQMNNTCCEVLGTRLYSSLPEYIYSIAKDGLYVDLYQPSTIEWKQDGQEMRLQMRTQFPFQPHVSLRMTVEQPTRSKIRIRVPSWAFDAMETKVNGQRAGVGAPGSYLTIDRTWNTGDMITFTLPMKFRVTQYHGADEIKGHSRYAIEYGPILMAAVGPLDPQLGVHIIQHPDRLESWLKPISDKPLHFTVDGHPEYEFMPYWQVMDQTYTCFPVIEPVAVKGPGK